MPPLACLPKPRRLRDIRGLSFQHRPHDSSPWASVSFLFEVKLSALVNADLRTKITPGVDEPNAKSMRRYSTVSDGFSPFFTCSLPNWSICFDLSTRVELVAIRRHPGTQREMSNRPIAGVGVNQRRFWLDGVGTAQRRRIARIP